MNAHHHLRRDLKRGEYVFWILATAIVATGLVLEMLS
jgi:hypothetical protein